MKGSPGSGTGESHAGPGVFGAHRGEAAQLPQESAGVVPAQDQQLRAGQGAGDRADDHLGRAPGPELRSPTPPAARYVPGTEVLPDGSATPAITRTLPRGTDRHDRRRHGGDRAERGTRRHRSPVALTLVAAALGAIVVGQTLGPVQLPGFGLALAAIVAGAPPPPTHATEGISPCLATEAFWSRARPAARAAPSPGESSTTAGGTRLCQRPDRSPAAPADVPTAPPSPQPSCFPPPAPTHATSVRHSPVWGGSGWRQK